MFTINVNDYQTYDFYVLSDDGNNIALIMNQNLYEEGNTTEPAVAWNVSGNATDGPLTALEALKTRTATWRNIEEYSYTPEEKDGIYADYSGEYVQNVRARLPRLSDITTAAIGCTEGYSTCPYWIFGGLYSTGYNNTFGYWLSDAYSSQFHQWAWYVYYLGSVDYGDAHEVFVNDVYLGVRPVIELSK